MAVLQQTMTDKQRKSVALEYLKRLDRAEGFFFIYLDPDYACADTARYPWLAARTDGSAQSSQGLVATA